MFSQHKTSLEMCGWRMWVRFRRIETETLTQDRRKCQIFAAVRNYKSILQLYICFLTLLSFSFLLLFTHNTICNTTLSQCAVDAVSDIQEWITKGARSYKFSRFQKDTGYWTTHPQAMHPGMCMTPAKAGKHDINNNIKKSFLPVMCHHKLKSWMMLWFSVCLQCVMLCSFSYLLTPVKLTLSINVNKTLLISKLLNNFTRFLCGAFTCHRNSYSYLCVLWM